MAARNALLLILALVVFGAGIHVRLTVAQDGINKLRQLVRRGGDGLGAPIWAFFQLRNLFGALSERCCSVGAGLGPGTDDLATGNAVVGTQPQPRREVLGILPFLMSVPTSLTILRAV